MTVAEAVKILDVFYERHPEQKHRDVREVAAFIRSLDGAEGGFVQEATRTLARAFTLQSSSRVEKRC